jgi:hypothetical protein
VVGNDIAERAALGDDPVHAGVGRQLLPQRVDRRKCNEHRVERVDAKLEAGGGVGRLTEELHPAAPGGDHPGVGDVVHARVDQHHRVDPAEESFVAEDVLAAATLLPRRAEHDDGATELLDDRLQADPGTHAGGGDHVVAAAVAVRGEAVVFAQERDRRPRPGTGRAAERGGQGTQAPLDGEPLCIEEIAEP